MMVLLLYNSCTIVSSVPDTVCDTLESSCATIIDYRYKSIYTKYINYSKGVTALFGILASKTVDLLVKNNIIEAKERTIYAYGYELLLSSATGIVILQILSILMGNPTAWIHFLLGFIPFRLTGGGFHAKSHSRCISLFSTVYVVAMIFNNHIGAVRFLGLLANLSLAFLFIVISPVAASNKPVPVARKKTLRRLGFLLGIINALICALVETHIIPVKIPSMYYIGNSTAGVSMLVGYFTTKKEVKHEEGNS